jgi:putative ATP-dependent endonuclease of OLD family
LVEGVAEQLLVPVLAERLGRPLAPSGVAVINIGGVAFRPFTDLFGPEKLPYRLAVISDDDRQADSGDEDGGEEQFSTRAKDLQGRAGDNVHVALAPRTLEWALSAAGNKDVMLDALEPVKPLVAKRLRGELDEASNDDAADAILKAVEGKKGQYAQELADLLADPNVKFEVPEYLSEAIAWVTAESAKLA